MSSIIFEVKGATANFKLENDEIRSYEFSYSVSDSKYAKGSKDKRELVIKGSIPRTLTRNETAMKEIREWAKEKYKDPSFYSHVKVTAVYRDDVVREITFPNAFIKSYEEEINPHSGDGIYTITLLQKIDKRIKIIIDPFNVEHPTLSELCKEREEARVKAATPAAKLPPANAILPITSLIAYVGNNPLVHFDSDSGNRYLVIDGHIEALQNNTHSHIGFVELNELSRLLNKYGIHSFVNPHTDNVIYGNINSRTYSINLSHDILPDNVPNTEMRTGTNISSAGSRGYFPVFVCQNTSTVYVGLNQFMTFAGLSDRVKFFDESTHKEGFGFATADDAALAFALIYGPITREESETRDERGNRQGRERMAHIYYDTRTRTGDKVFRFDDVVSGSSNAVWREPNTKRGHVAIVHTHPFTGSDGDNLFSGRISTTNQRGFSRRGYSGDGVIAQEFSVPVYLVAPNGRLMRLEPRWRAEGDSSPGFTIDRVPERNPFAPRLNYTTIHNTLRGEW